MSLNPTCISTEASYNPESLLAGSLTCILIREWITKVLTRIYSFAGWTVVLLLAHAWIQKIPPGDPDTFFALFSIINAFHRGPRASIEKQLDSMGSFASQVGPVPEFFKKTIANCDFPGMGQVPTPCPPPPLNPPMLPACDETHINVCVVEKPSHKTVFNVNNKMRLYLSF